MKFLIIVQDLRVSGTSEGIVSRSFLSKLRINYPDSIIDVLYLKHNYSDDQLHLLPINSIETHVLNLKIPLFTKWANKVFWRLFNVSLAVSHIHKVYGSYIAKVDHQKYDHIFIRSAGIDHETILGAKDLPILKKAIVNFHDPYPLFWYAGSKCTLTGLELFKLKNMYKVITQAKSCVSSANFLSEDMQYLYGSRKKIYTLPHQYSESVFDLSDTSTVLKKNNKVTISYHGAIMFGRNVDNLLDAYQELVNDNILYKENTEFVLRLKGMENKRLVEKFSKSKNIVVLDTLNFSNSCYEQKYEADILIILENGPLFCNILVGKAPFLAALKKPILSISPERSEMRRIITDYQYIASSNDKEEIKRKLENLIINRLSSNEFVYPFGDYFSDKKFKESLDKILSESNNSK
ncbi:hypothetical protein [Flavobacterium sp. 11]|uniref:hypothetical protein n=1 Tax=Flavobacterium sp. 11 TaxID=357523 RepID=UPI000C18421E|nr:hypothetical protein [Flavobacterium sp. 11]PIF60602.1 glycosyltransferase involved in cell wall biosynthesis [Flavobacterium sp. 11]